MPAFADVSQRRRQSPPKTASRPRRVTRYARFAPHLLADTVTFHRCRLHKSDENIPAKQPKSLWNVGGRRASAGRPTAAARGNCGGRKPAGAACGQTWCEPVISDLGIWVPFRNAANSTLACAEFHSTESPA